MWWNCWTVIRLVSVFYFIAAVIIYMHYISCYQTLNDIFMHISLDQRKPVIQLDRYILKMIDLFTYEFCSICLHMSVHTPWFHACIYIKQLILLHLFTYMQLSHPWILYVRCYPDLNPRACGWGGQETTTIAFAVWMHTITNIAACVLSGIKQSLFFQVAEFQQFLKGAIVKSWENPFFPCS